MSAITGLISLLSSFIELLITGVDAVIGFARVSFTYLQLFVGFFPPQFVSLFLIVIVIAIVYLIVGR